MARSSVLIVDDHAPFRAMAGRLLAEAGFDIVGEAGDGMSAVRLAEAVRPDVVLLDVVLPDIDGFEVARRLDRLPERPAVVLISSRDGSDYGSRIANAPVRGFVSKAEFSGSALARVLDGSPG